MRMNHTVTKNSNDQCIEHLMLTDILKMTAASIVSRDVEFAQNIRTYLPTKGRNFCFKTYCTTKCSNVAYYLISSNYAILRYAILILLMWIEDIFFYLNNFNMTNGKCTGKHNCNYIVDKRNEWIHFGVGVFFT